MSDRVYDNFYHHNRNYGCRCHEVIWRGFRTLVLENEKLRVSIWGDKGTDVVELLYKPKDIDFMWRSPLEVDAHAPVPVSKELDSGTFLDFYEGGWQEMLPAITNPTNYKGMQLGFHGEVAYLAWDYQVLVDTPEQIKVRFFVRMRRSPLYVTKTITLKSNLAVLEFEETVLNEGDEDFKLMWGHHPTFGKPLLDENCLVDLPAGAVGKTYQVDFSGNSPFECDKEFDWPCVEDKQGRTVDLSRAMPPSAKTAFNTYVKNLSEGWYGITNPKQEVGIGFQWDVNVFPYLLLWSVYRGHNEYPFYGRTYNLAIELYSAIPDSLDEVIELGRAINLPPGGEISTRFSTIVYESGTRIKGFTDDQQVIT